MSDIGFEVDTLTVCRICLQHSDEETLSIFDRDASNDSMHLYEKIEKCGGIKVLDDPELPSRICKKCNLFLTIAHKFRVICQNSDDYLREFVCKSTSCIIEDDIDDGDAEYLIEECNETKDNSESQEIKSPSPSKTLGISSDGTAVIRVKAEPQLPKEKPLHICEICGNSYPRKYALEAHMRRHRDEKLYECELCQKSFHLNSQLTRHMRKHTGVRPYGCSYCKRNFVDRTSLVKHEMIHRDERPYTCTTCGKSFTYSSVLRVHQLTHTGEKPFSCGICGKKFARAHHLRAHLETLLHQNDPRSKVLLRQIKQEAYSIYVATSP